MSKSTHGCTCTCEQSAKYRYAQGGSFQISSKPYNGKTEEICGGVLQDLHLIPMLSLQNTCGLAQQHLKRPTLSIHSFFLKAELKSIETR